MTLLALPAKILRFLHAIAIALSSVLYGCATNPVTGDRDFVLMSESEEIQLGQRYHQQLLQQMPAYADETLGDYVNQVGHRIAKASHRPDLDYHFTVVDSRQVNAFALPGGYIYITRGLLAYLGSEAELAAVLGHEIGHVTARHSVRQHSASTAAGVAGLVLQATTGVSGARDLFNVFGKAILSGYGREHELESDRLGARYLAQTGYDPQAMLDVIGVLKNQELFEAEQARQEGREPRAYHGVFASHPDNDRRLQEVVGEAGRPVSGTAGRTGRLEFLKLIDGLAFGDSEKEGVVSGIRFLHKPLNFALTFPDGWRIENHPDHLLAAAPDDAALLKVQTETLTGPVSPQQYLTNKGLRNLSAGTALQIDGFKGYSARAPVSTNMGQRTARFTVLHTDTHAFVFSGIARKPDALDIFDKDFLGVAQSYRKLNDEERERAAGQRLQIIKANAGTRFADLARTSPVTEQAESHLRLLNDMYPAGEPVPGQLIKIVR